MAQSPFGHDQRERIELQRVKAVLHRLRGSSRQIFVARAAEIPAVAVGPQTVVDASAEKFVDGNVQRSRLDVEQGLLDRAHGGVDDRAAALGPEAMIINLAPQRLDAQRVDANHVSFDDILQHAGGTGAADTVGDTGLAQPGDADVGLELEQDRPDAAALDEVDASGCELHRRILAGRWRAAWRRNQGNGVTGALSG